MNSIKNMSSIKSIYKIGKGPFSSHKMGPHLSSIKFLKYLESNKLKPERIIVILQGSLALTGKGHLTDIAVREVFKNYLTQIIFDYDTKILSHPNTMILEANGSNDQILARWQIHSIGGGEIVINVFNKDKDIYEELKEEFNKELSYKKKFDIYPFSKMNDILNYLKKNCKNFWKFIVDFEGFQIYDYLKDVWDAMKN